MQGHDMQTTLEAENVYRYNLGDQSLTKLVKSEVIRAKQENSPLRMWDEEGRFLQLPILPPYTVLTLLASDYLILINGQRYGYWLKKEDQSGMITEEAINEEARQRMAVDPNHPEVIYPHGKDMGKRYFALEESEFELLTQMAKKGVAVPLNDPYFYRLAVQLQAAYNQASKGKGAERHAGKDGEGRVNQAFHDQRIVMNAKVHGMGSPCGQVTKKIAEGCDMVRRGEANRGLLEFYGAINYIAALCIAVEDGVKN